MRRSRTWTYGSTPMRILSHYASLNTDIACALAGRAAATSKSSVAGRRASLAFPGRGAAQIG